MEVWFLEVQIIHLLLSIKEVFLQKNPDSLSFQLRDRRGLSEQIYKEWTCTYSSRLCWSCLSGNNICAFPCGSRYYEAPFAFQMQWGIDHRQWRSWSGGLFSLRIMATCLWEFRDHILQERAFPKNLGSLTVKYQPSNYSMFDLKESFLPLSESLNEVFLDLWNALRESLQTWRSGGILIKTVKHEQDVQGFLWGSRFQIKTRDWKQEDVDWIEYG